MIHTKLPENVASLVTEMRLEFAELGNFNKSLIFDERYNIRKHGNYWIWKFYCKTLETCKSVENLINSLTKQNYYTYLVKVDYYPITSKNIYHLEVWYCELDDEI